MSAKRTNRLKEQAGAEWARLRNERGWGQKDVSQASLKFGPDNFISVSQLSRIEKGQFDRVSLDDAVTLGQVFDLTPAQVAEMYGLYHDRNRQFPQAVLQAEQMASVLPEELGAHFLEDINWLVARYTALQREREEAMPKRQRRSTEPPAATHVAV